ncbi:hypothetical protein LDENG_00144080 [Lucifuga dentata]|nr:hypothetical protein LDENG_00144080 [Lucifuga dentata]
MDQNKIMLIHLCHDLFFGHFLFYFVVLVFCCLVCFTSSFCLVSLQFSPSPVFYQLITSSVFILPWVPLFSARLSCLLVCSPCLLVCLVSLFLVSWFSCLYVCWFVSFIFFCRLPCGLSA